MLENLKKYKLVLVAAALIIGVVVFSQCGKKPEPPAAVIVSASTGSEEETSIAEEISEFSSAAEDINLEIKKPDGTSIKLQAGKLSLEASKEIREVLLKEAMWDDQESVDSPAAAEKGHGLNFDLLPSFDLQAHKFNLGILVAIKSCDNKFYDCSMGGFVNFSRGESNQIENIGLIFGLNDGNTGIDIFPNYDLQSKRLNLGASIGVGFSKNCHAGPVLNVSLSGIENAGATVGCRITW